MHNYTPANSLQQKRANWGMLNKKVLSNFGLDLPDVIITGLSNGKPGLVEVLLFNLRLKIDEELELQQKMQQQSQTNVLSPRQSSLSHLTTKTNQSILLSNRSNKFNQQFSQKDISRVDYEEIKQQCLQQQEQIEVLHAKIRRLEHVLQLKDIRISELSKAVEDSRPTRPTAVKK